LNVTKQSETELKEKLHVAVKHLETAHSQLLQRSQSLQLFMNRFGEHSVAAKKPVVSILQHGNAASIWPFSTGSNASDVAPSPKASNKSRAAHHSEKPKVQERKSAALPEVSTVLQNSHRVFTDMSSQMAALEARLAEV
jgi:hypothetical protein